MVALPYLILEKPPKGEGERKAAPSITLYYMRLAKALLAKAITSPLSQLYSLERGFCLPSFMAPLACWRGQRTPIFFGPEVVSQMELKHFPDIFFSSVLFIGRTQRRWWLLHVLILVGGWIIRHQSLPGGDSGGGHSAASYRRGPCQPDSPCGDGGRLAL